MSFFDRNGAGTCSGGEALRPALEIEDKDGNLVELTGRTFVYWITAAGAKLHESVAAVCGTRAVASIPGAKTRELAGRVGLEHWWIEQVTDGFREWSRAKLSVRTAGPDAIGLAAPAEDVVRVTDRGVLRVVANGAPGAGAGVQLKRALDAAGRGEEMLDGSDTSFLAFVDKVAAAIAERQVNGAGLVSGGGALTGNLQLKVEAASNADAIAGFSTTKAVTPKALKAAIDTSRDAIRAEVLASFVPLISTGTADGGETTIEAPAEVPADAADLATVIIGGIEQDAGEHFTSDGSTTLTLTFPLYEGARWKVKMFSRSLGA